MDIARVAIALVFFAFASASDWRTRRVSNLTWILLGAVAFAVFWADLLLRGASPLSQSLLLPSLFLFIDIFWEKKGGARGIAWLSSVVLYAVAFAWTIYAAATVAAGTTEWTPEISGPMMVFLMIAVFELFYMFDVIKGGADAKAVVCLAVMFPWYPEILGGLPVVRPAFDAIPDFFTFALSVLFVGALISLAIPLYLLTKNIRAGRKISGRSLVGFQLPIDEVKGHFVWLVEWVEEGGLKFSARKPRDSSKIDEDLAALRGLGRNEVWVTYKIPFIIPLTAGMVFVLIVGNPLFALY